MVLRLAGTLPYAMLVPAWPSSLSIPIESFEYLGFGFEHVSNQFGRSLDSLSKMQTIE